MFLINKISQIRFFLILGKRKEKYVPYRTYAPSFVCFQTVYVQYIFLKCTELFSFEEMWNHVIHLRLVN
jgi:hypothetical protein